MKSFRISLKEAYGSYLGGYFRGLVADTDAVAEFAARSIDQAVVWVSGRMVDSVEEMIAAWRKRDTSGAPKAITRLPVVFVAMARDYETAPSDWAHRLQGDPVLVKVPSDPLGRILQMRTVQRSIRTQLVVMAQEEATADSLMMQLHLYLTAMSSRRFDVDYGLIGSNETWPCVIEQPDIIAPTQALESEKNLTILAADVTLRPMVPFLSGPRSGEPHDGQGSGTADDPHGYPPFRQANININTQPSTDVVTATDITRTAK